MDHSIFIYETKEGISKIEVKLIDDSLWLSLKQISELFNRDKSVISRHLKKIFKEGELDQDAVVANFATTAADGKSYKVEFYNLDAIISVGYRVNSKQGTLFRKWSSEVLKDHLTKGYSINEKTLAQKGFRDIERTLSLLAKTLQKNELNSDLTVDVITLIRLYAKSWDTLLRYDENRLELPKDTFNLIEVFNYEEATLLINAFKKELKQKGEATELFGKKKQEELKAILGNLNQTFAGEPLYKNVFERAAHLLYFIIKDHPFIDGNKRIGSFLFLVYLNKIDRRDKSFNKVSDNSLTALALLVAESAPQDKELIIRLISNLIN